MHIIFPNDFVGCIDGCAAWNTTATCAGVSWVLGSPGPSGGYTCYMKWALRDGSYTYNEASASLLQSTAHITYPSNSRHLEHCEHNCCFQRKCTLHCWFKFGIVAGEKDWWNSRRNSGCTLCDFGRIHYLVEAAIGDVVSKDACGFLFKQMKLE